MIVCGMTGEVAAPEREAADPTTDWSFWDLAIAVALAAAAFVLRLQYFPRNGLFHDDAWAAASVSLTSPSEWLRTSVEHPGFTLMLSPLRWAARDEPTVLLYPVLVAGRVGAGRRLRLPASIGLRAEHQLRARGARGHRAGCHRALRPPEDVRHRSQHRRDPRRGAAPHRGAPLDHACSRSCGSSPRSRSRRSAHSRSSPLPSPASCSSSRRTTIVAPRAIAIAAQLFLQLVYFYRDQPDLQRPSPRRVLAELWRLHRPAGQPVRRCRRLLCPPPRPREDVPGRLGRRRDGCGHWSRSLPSPASFSRRCAGAAPRRGSCSCCSRSRPWPRACTSCRSGRAAAPISGA